MKKIILFLLVLAVSAGVVYTQKAKKSANTESASKVENGKKYEVKSGIIEYEHSEMMGMKTSSVLYFDDYGKIEVRENFMNGNVEMFGMKISNEKLDVTIEKGDGYFYSFTLKDISNGEDKTVKEISRMKIEALQGMAGAMLGMDMMKKMDYREEGSEVVAGLTGTKYSIAMDKNKPNDRMYGVMYKNIPLKTTITGMGMTMEIIAKKVQLDVAFPKAKLEMPKDYKIVDNDEKMKEMMKSLPKGDED